MKNTLLAAIAATALGAGAASAATVSSETVSISGTLGIYEFSLAAAGEYDITIDPATPVFGLSVIGAGPSLEASGTGLLDDVALAAGDYLLFLSSSGFQGEVTVTISSDDPQTPAVPLPAAGPLLLLALGGVGALASRRRRSA